MTDKIKKYYMITFGCQLNFAQSEKIAAWYKSRGWKMAKNWQEADEVVINSCSVREAAENRVGGMVNKILKQVQDDEPRQVQDGPSTSLRMTHKKRVRKPRIILTGCMVGSAIGERKRYSLRQLGEKLPQVDEFKPWWEWDLEKIKAFETRKNRKQALVPIMTGCDHFCSYCVVPYAKKKEVSRPIEEIICEVEELVKRGWKEIMLLGQNVNRYGRTVKSSKSKVKSEMQNFSFTEDKSQFAVLLERLCQIPELKKISFMTSNPWDLSDDIIQVMKLEKIDRYLHLPLQSGDDEILKRMNRPYTAKKYLDLVKKIKEEIPQIKIGTDVIVGFPGETKEAFENTVKVCRQVGFEKAYIAKYSPRPGTLAFKMNDDVAPAEKKRRWWVLEKMINTVKSQKLTVNNVKIQMTKDK